MPLASSMARVTCSMEAGLPVVPVMGSVAAVWVVQVSVQPRKDRSGAEYRAQP